jgi:hypothetical protein
MSNRQDAHLVKLRQKSIKRDVSGSSERNYELTQIPLSRPPYQWVQRQRIDGRPDGSSGLECNIDIALRQEQEGTFEVLDCPWGIDYRRHGFGRGALSPLASRSSQACTSSAL